MSQADQSTLFSRMRHELAGSWARQTLVLSLAWPLTACLDNKLEEPDGTAADGGTTGEAANEEFLALTSDFAHYADWMLFEKDVTTEHGGLVGKTSIYVSQIPDETSHKFPVGAILLKTMQTAESDKLTIHAMSKRGSRFNIGGAGAAGWEYFELLLNAKGTPYILWRGDKPPSGEQYKLLLGGETMPTTEGDCNDCHGTGKDGVLGDEITSLLTAP